MPLNMGLGSQDRTSRVKKKPPDKKEKVQTKWEKCREKHIQQAG